MRKSGKMWMGAAAAVTAAGLSYGASVAMAAGSASDADRAFVAKVSQGGLYEVEAGRVAAMRGTVPVVRDFGALDTRDHEGVNSQLKKIASATGVEIKPGLNAEFSARLAKLKAVPADKFNAFYVEDMKQIHNGDEALFVQEAGEGSGSYKQFATETGVLVKAHLGWLNTL